VAMLPVAVSSVTVLPIATVCAISATGMGAAPVALGTAMKIAATEPTTLAAVPARATGAAIVAPVMIVVVAVAAACTVAVEVAPTFVGTTVIPAVSSIARSRPPLRVAALSGFAGGALVPTGVASSVEGLPVEAAVLVVFPAVFLPMRSSAGPAVGSSPAPIARLESLACP
ncbi:MAG: hypothetical protein LKI88_01255, partial [Bifidobacterium sp.]|nr:hypothetical protein [Bifidobacterium sp.]